jgi:two-component system, NarL family, sensor histidine kinase UhpB
MKKIYLLLFFWFVYIQAPAQYPKTIDSLKVFLKTQKQDTIYVLALSEYTFLIIKEGKYAESEKYIKQMEDLSIKLNYGTGFYRVMNMRGMREYLKQDHKKALEYFMKCNEIIEKYNLPKRVRLNSLNNISLNYWQMGDRENSTKFAMQVIEYQDANKLEPQKSGPYDIIGTNLKYDKKYDEALKYFQKQLAIDTKNNSTIDMAIAENNIGSIYEDLKNNKEAIKHNLTGLNYAEKANYTLLQTDFLTNLGRMYKAEKDFTKAENYLKKSERFCRELEAGNSLKLACQGLGDLYFAQKNYVLAEKYYLESLEISKKMGVSESIYTINQALADLYEAKKDYQKAFKYQTEAGIYKDSTFKIETTKNTEDLLRKYEAKEKEQQIALLSEKNEKSSFQNKSLIAGGLLLLLLTGISAVFFVNRNKLKRLEESQQLRNRIAADLHDEIGSTLSSILLISGMAKKTDDAEKNDKMFTKIHTDSQHVMESVDEIIWSVNPVNDSLKGIILRLREYAQPLAESKNIAFELKADEAIENLNLSMEIRRNLYLIVKEAINNLIKYSEATEASVYFQQDKKGILITIKDNGKGFDNEMVTSRSGLKNMKIRAKEIHGKMVIESSGNGSEISLSFEV